MTKKPTDREVQMETLCKCGHSLRLHLLTFMAPCVGTFGDLKDMDNMKLCECVKFSEKSGGRGR